jgi:hypothetical protein
MERHRLGDESRSRWDLERAPRLSTVFGTVVNLAMGERGCLETIKTSANVILNVLKRLT